MDARELIKQIEQLPANRAAPLFYMIAALIRAEDDLHGPFDRAMRGAFGNDYDDWNGPPRNGASDAGAT